MTDVNLISDKVTVRKIARSRRLLGVGWSIGARLLRAGYLLFVVCAGSSVVPAQAAAPKEPAAEANCALKAPPPEAVKHRWGAGDVYEFPGNAGKGYTGCVRMWIFRMEGELYLDSTLRLKLGRLESYRSTEQATPGRYVVTECTYREGKVLSRAVQPAGVTVTWDCPEAQAMESAIGASDVR